MAVDEMRPVRQINVDFGMGCRRRELEAAEIAECQI